MSQEELWPFLSSANPTKVVSSFGKHITAGLPHIPMGSGHQWCVQSPSSSAHCSQSCTELKDSQRHQSLSLTLLSLGSLNTWAVLCCSCMGTTREGCMWTGTRSALPELEKELAQEAVWSGEVNTSGLWGHQLPSPSLLQKLSWKFMLDFVRKPSKMPSAQTLLIAAFISTYLFWEIPL